MSKKIKVLFAAFMISCAAFGQTTEQKIDSAQRILDKISATIDSMRMVSLNIVVRGSLDSVSEIIFHLSPDSSIEINGDTSRALWEMYKYLKEYNDKYYAARRVISEFTKITWPPNKMPPVVSKEIRLNLADYLIETELKKKF